MLAQYSGLRVVVSEFAYEIIVNVRGFPVKNKPNRYRPIYRKVKIIKPLIYRMGDQIICHPSVLAKIQSAVAQSAISTIEAKIRDVSGFMPVALQFQPLQIEPKPQDENLMRFQHNYGVAFRGMGGIIDPGSVS